MKCQTGFLGKIRKNVSICPSVLGWVGGGGKGGVRFGLLGVNCGTGVRASISKPTPFIYPAFEKTDPVIYWIIRNADLFIYCPLIFFGLNIFYSKVSI